MTNNNLQRAACSHMLLCPLTVVLCRVSNKQDSPGSRVNLTSESVTCVHVRSYILSGIMAASAQVKIDLDSVARHLVIAHFRYQVCCGEMNCCSWYIWVSRLKLQYAFYWLMWKVTTRQIALVLCDIGCLILRMCDSINWQFDVTIYKDIVNQRLYTVNEQM